MADETVEHNLWLATTNTLALMR